MYNFRPNHKGNKVIVNYSRYADASIDLGVGASPF